MISSIHKILASMYRNHLYLFAYKKYSYRNLTGKEYQKCLALREIGRFIFLIYQSVDF